MSTAEALNHLSIVKGLIHADYRGPLVVAGGFQRDQMLRLPAKDLDVFLLEDPQVDFRQLADKVAMRFNGRVTNVIGGYREWSDDVYQVYQIDVGPALPFRSIDLIILKVGDAGYSGTWTEAGFLSAVCERVDLRLNAVGVGYEGTIYCHFRWSDDVQEKRLVVQACRVNPEDRPRQQRRLDRLTAPGAKFEGWTCWEEQADGSLAPWVPC